MIQWIEALRNHLGPLLARYGYKIKLSFYALPLLIQWIYPVSFEKDETSRITGERTMVLFFYYLGATIVIYLLGILFLILVPLPYHFVLAPIQYGSQTLITFLYFFISLYYSFKIFKGADEVHPSYTKFSAKIESLLSK